MSEFRKGVCKDCSAEFNIPASFPHDRAKCRQCGGTVEIAPAAGAEPKPEPKPVPAATPPAPKPKAAPSEAPKSEAPKPKPVAPKAAAPEPKAPQPKPEPAAEAPAPAEKPMTMKEKIIARKKAEAEAAAAAAAKPAAPVKKATPKTKPAPSAKRAKREESPASGSRRKPAGKRSGGKRGKRGADEESGGRRGRREKPEKKAPVGGILAIAALVIGGGAGWYFMAGPGKAEPKKADIVAAGETDEPVQTDAELAAEETAKQAEVEAATAEAQAAKAAKADAKQKKAPKKPKVYEPMAVTYDAIPIFGPAVGTTDEEWADLQDLVATATDMSAGARQGRASKKLMTYGYKSVPAILNAFREVDLSDDLGNRLGDLLQRTITDLLNGKNAGWLYDQEDGLMIPRAHAHNRKVVLTYLKMWNEVVKDPTAWIGVAKLGTAKYADQLAAYSAALLADGVTDGEFFEYVIGGGADSSAAEEDDLDDF